MEAKLRAIATGKVYEEFEPATEWVKEEDCDTLLLFLPDFKKEHLKVQLISTQSLIISGERQVEGNKWRHFKKQLTISTNCDAQKISARFDGSILYVKQPKLITPAENKDSAKPAIEAPEPRKPENDQPQPQKNDQEPNRQKTASMTAPARRANEKPNELDTAKMVAEKRNGSVDSKNVSEKASEREKTNPENAPKKAIEKEKNSGTPQDQKVSRDTSEKHKKSSVNDDTRRQEGAYGKKADSGNARLEDTKLKMIKRVMNMVLVILFALLLGLYLTNLIRTWKKGEN